MKSDPSTTPLGALAAAMPRILRNAFIIAAVAVAASFLVPNKFTAASVLLPPSEESELMGLFSSLAGGAGGLARGLGISTTNRSNIFIGVLRSGTVGRRMIESFDLVKVYKVKDIEKALKELGSNTSITFTNEGLIRIAVTDRSPTLASALANAYVVELDRWVRENAILGARQRRGFLENRLGETQQALARAEDTLRDYQVRKRLPAAGSSGERAVEAAAELVAQKVQREIELGTLETVSRTSTPRAEELRMQIRQIDTELMKIPPSTTELSRLYRNVRIQERILIVLAEESERARVMELKNIPVVEVIDQAQPPLHKSFPRRSLVALASFGVAFAVHALLILLRDSALRPA